MTQVFITLPVADLERSKAYYSAIGLTLNAAMSDHSSARFVIEDDHSAYMLVTREFFQSMTDLPIGDPAAAPSGATSILLDTRDEVDARTAAGLGAGGTEPREARRREEAEVFTLGVLDNNIDNMREQPPLLAPVFRSDGQARLLASLLLSGDELTIRDLADRAGLAYATAHGEVTRLLDAGILRQREIGRARLISQNPDSPLVKPLRDILLVVSGPVVLLSEALDTISGVQRAFLYGSFAARARGVEGPAPNDIDLMVIGTPEPAAIYEVTRRVEQAVGRPINPTILTEAEFDDDSGFLRNVRANPTVPIIGSAR